MWNQQAMQYRTNSRQSPVDSDTFKPRAKKRANGFLSYPRNRALLLQQTEQQLSVKYHTEYTHAVTWLGSCESQSEPDRTDTALQVSATVLVCRYTCSKHAAACSTRSCIKMLIVTHVQSSLPVETQLQGAQGFLLLHSEVCITTVSMPCYSILQ